MAGHSTWSKVQYIKGPLDQKRGQLFSKLAKEITDTAKMGGGDRAGDSMPVTNAAHVFRPSAVAEDRGAGSHIHPNFASAEEALPLVST
jgi:hypothetical protein